uniref:Peptidase A2 domain-containing protein n=1 Tax=Panagrolaimus superbus TaxID=310955 RepID=A0A914YEG9_9BILA
MVNVIVNGITLSAQMDDGADLTMMAKVDYTKIGSPALAGPTISANTANGHDLKLLGSFKSMVDLRGKSRLVEFHVADIKSTLLGTNFFKTFGIDLVMDGEVLCNMVVGHSMAPVKKVEELMDKFKPLFEPALGQLADAKDGMDECLSTRRINTIVTAPVTAHEINAALAEDVTATLRDKGKRMSGINFDCFSRYEC